MTVDDQTTPTKVRINQKKSKCDQFGTGADIIVGRTHSFLCPVAAIVSYMVEQGQRPDPFFIDTGGKVLTKARFVGVIRGVLGSIGLPQHQYAGHSFRIGAATSVSQAGWRIPQYRHWKGGTVPPSYSIKGCQRRA